MIKCFEINTTEAEHLQNHTVLQVTDCYPLTTGQLAIWISQILDIDSPVFNVGEYLDIQSEIDVELFRAATRLALDESDTFHLHFIDTHEGPKQFFSHNSDWEMPFFDVSAEVDPSAAAISWMRDDIERSHDLIHGSLYTFVLFKLKPDRFYYYQRWHHIISDGFSRWLFVKKIFNFYTSPPDVKLERQPAGSWLDVLQDNECYVNSPIFKQDSIYWLNQLKGMPEPVTLSGKPPARISCRQPVRYADYMAYPLAKELRVLGKSYGGSLTRVFVAAAILYLYRFTGERDIVIGLPVTARTNAKIRNIPGVQSNIIPLRVRVEPGQTFGELIKQTAEYMTEALTHQRYPTDAIRNDLGLKQSGGSLYGLMINIRPFDYDLSDTGLLVSNHVLHAGPAFDIALDINYGQDKGDLHFDLIGNSHNYSEESISMHLRRVLNLLARLPSIAADLPLNRISLLDEVERQTVLYDFNATTTEYHPENTCVHQLFEAQATRNPDAYAVVFEDQRMTYAELNARANQLARFLRNQGVVPDALIAICMERSIDMIVGLLGILKAGGGYVQLDPSYPSERIACMLLDAKPIVVLTYEHLLDLLPPTQALIVALDRDRSLIESQEKINLDSGILGLTSRHLAYVIYTSGSTGQPKGVLVEHEGVLNLVRAAQSIYLLNKNDRVLQFSSINFDISVEECFGALCTGSCLVLRTDAWISDTATFWRHCENAKISVVDIPTAFWHQVVSDEHVIPSCVRQIIIGGEKVNPELVRRWLARGNPSPRLTNTYGPTETTVIATFNPIEGTETHPNSIGRPISNTQVYILDTSLQPVPIGMTGELYIGGVGVARGYLNNSELTTERFVASPFSTDPTIRLYKTGDIGRWLPDGNIEYLGRNDTQVKVRGFRVEMGEIESALLQHPAVHEAVVIAREDTTGKRLIAYYTSDGSIGAEALRVHLTAYLPEYMVPVAYVRLEALPLTPNGKLDRQALPEPKGDAYAVHSYEAPQGETEEALAGIWAKLLKIERVGRDDNFFELGGHSLLAMEMLSEVNQKFQINLPLLTVFKSPTVAQMAESLHTQDRLTHCFSLFPVQQAGSRVPLSWVGYSIECSEVAESLGKSQSIYGLRYGIGVPLFPPQKNSLTLPPIEKLATHYIAELQTVQPEGPYVLIGHSFFGVVAFEMAQQLTHRGEKVALLALIDSYVPNPSYISNSLKDVFAKLRRVKRDELIKNSIVLMKRIKRRTRLSLRPETYSPNTALPLDIARSLLENYHPKAYSGKVVLFKAMELESAIATEKNIFKRKAPPEQGWQKLVEDGLIVYETPGNHSTILQGQSSALIAQVMMEYLS
jgi:amino acid adenylation domain-containing protein